MRINAMISLKDLTLGLQIEHIHIYSTWIRHESLERVCELN